jgi:hypothetical protein
MNAWMNKKCGHAQKNREERSVENRVPQLHCKEKKNIERFTTETCNGRRPIADG